jgi:hypothetical protein
MAQSDNRLPPNASTEQKLDFLVNNAIAMNMRMDALEQLKVNVVAVEASVAKNTGDICDLQKEVKGLKQQLNARDQENRANALRLTGFPYVKEEKGNRSVLQKAVFDRILKPILDAAVSNGQIAPPTKQLEFDCFRVGRWPPPRVPGSAAV